MSARRDARYQDPRLRAIFATLAVVGTLAAAAAAPADAHVYTFTVEAGASPRGDLDSFAAVARETLNDRRGWSLAGGIEFRQVRSNGMFRLILADPTYVARAHSVCSPRWSCRVGDRVMVNDARWRSAPSGWPLGQPAYRRYVVTHEVGHWLGLGHWSCPGSGRSAPVMQQQSISLDGCDARIWPLEAEKRQVADTHGVSYAGQRSDDRRLLLLTWPYVTGRDVREWQRFLRREGIRNTAGERLAVDGIFGPETERATRIFQRQQGIQVDGIVGPQTRSAAGI